MRDGSDANWPEIIKIAKEAGATLGNGKKPGSWTRSVYSRSYQKACALGYHGTAHEWEIFVRVRG